MRMLVALLLLLAFSLPVCSGARRNYAKPRHHARSHAVQKKAVKRAAKARPYRAKRARKAHPARRAHGRRTAASRRS